MGISSTYVGVNISVNIPVISPGVLAYEGVIAGDLNVPLGSETTNVIFNICSWLVVTYSPINVKYAFDESYDGIKLKPVAVLPPT